MGTDGAKRVVVNSVGREIRTLEEMPPVEGRRVQLTIDADLQRAAEDGFRLAGFNGAALIMDPRNGEVLTYASLPSYDPNDFAVGIDRATWASLNTDKLQAAAEPRAAGPLFAGIHLQDRRRHGRARRGRGDARLTASPATAARTSSAATSSATSRAGTAAWTCATRIEKSCNVYFYTLGNMLGVDKIHKWAEKLGHGRQDRHRPAERAGEHRALHRVEAEALRREVVRRRDDLGVDRPGAGDGDAGVAGGDDLHRGQRRHARHAARAQGDRRGPGLEAGAGAGRGRHGRVQARHAGGAARRAVDGR